MKTALKIIFFSCLTILLLFVLEKNKQIRQYKIQEQHQLDLLDTLQLEINNLNGEIKIFGQNDIKFIYRGNNLDKDLIVFSVTLQGKIEKKYEIA